MDGKRVKVMYERLENKLKEYLARRGLPMTDELNPPFGLIFHSASMMNDQNKSYIVIGREAWAEGLHVAVEPATGIVWAVSAHAENKPVYVNASVELLLEYMHLLLRYRQQTAHLPSDSAPRIWTAEQARLRLEKLRRGEIKPAKANPEQSAAMEKERKAAFQQLERELRVLDPAAMQPASWWSKVMEETGYGLL